MQLACALTDIPEGQAKGLTLNEVPLFVVHYQERVYAYRNACPHLGVALEWQPDQFLDSEGRLIQCAMHGALFLIESGQCIAGPCSGQHLQSLACEVREGEVWVDVMGLS